MKNRRLKYARIFEFPPSAVAGGVNVKIYRDMGCTVDRFGEILAYSEELIRLNTELGILRIEGTDLMIREMDGETLMITGLVRGAVYEKYER